MNNKLFVKKKYYWLNFWPNILSVFAVLFMIMASLKGLWYCLGMLEKSQEFFIFVAIVFCIIFLFFWIGILILAAFSMKLIYYSMKVKVALHDDVLKFTFLERNTIDISKDQIEGSWNTPTKLTILIEYQDGKYKFGFLKKFYNRSVLREIETLMRSWGKYTEDRVLIRQKVKENSLNSLSSKNNFLTVLQKG